MEFLIASCYWLKFAMERHCSLTLIGSFPPEALSYPPLTIFAFPTNAMLLPFLTKAMLSLVPTKAMLWLEPLDWLDSECRTGPTVTVSTAVVGADFAPGGCRAAEVVGEWENDHLSDWFLVTSVDLFVSVFNHGTALRRQPRPPGP
jgi:hypothetical protein